MGNKNVIGKNRNSAEVPLKEPSTAAAATPAATSPAPAEKAGEKKTSGKKKDSTEAPNGKGSWTGHKYVFRMMGYISEKRRGYFDRASLMLKARSLVKHHTSMWMRVGGEWNPLTVGEAEKLAKAEKTSAEAAKVEKKTTPTPTVAETPAAQPTPAEPAAPVEIAIAGDAPAVFTS